MPKKQILKIKTNLFEGILPKKKSISTGHSAACFWNASKTFKMMLKNIIILINFSEAWTFSWCMWETQGLTPVGNLSLAAQWLILLVTS